MKPFRMLGRNARDAFKSIFRNFSLSLASLSCVTITLIVVSITMILAFNVDNLTTRIEEDVTIVVFLDRDIDEDRIDEIEKEIEKIDNVNLEEGIEFTDKMEIREQFMEASEIHAAIMAEWTTRETNSLQDTFHVRVIETEKIQETANVIGDIPGVSVVRYGEGMVEHLVSMFNSIQRGSIAIVIALILVTAFLISNTIKLTIFSRKKEIDIMRLVGASNLNIKIPFIFEGLLIGIIGSIVPVLLTIFGYEALFDAFDGYLFGAVLPLVEPSVLVYEVSAVLLIVAVAVGMLGSLRAVGKYLKI